VYAEEPCRVEHTRGYYNTVARSNRLGWSCDRCVTGLLSKWTVWSLSWPLRLRKHWRGLLISIAKIDNNKLWLCNTGWRVRQPESRKRMKILFFIVHHTAIWGVEFYPWTVYTCRPELSGRKVLVVYSLWTLKLSTLINVRRCVITVKHPKLYRLSFRTLIIPFSPVSHAMCLFWSSTLLRNSCHWAAFNQWNTKQP